MPKLQWFKFRPAVWRADAGLRLCSLAARGLWIELLGFMHESEKYGYLLVGGRPPTVKEIAKLVDIDPRTCKLLLNEIEMKGVSSTSDLGEVFSRRMVRDYAKHLTNQENGAKGGNPELRETVNQPDKAKSQESKNLREEIPPTPLRGECELTEFEKGRKAAQRKAIANAPRKKAPPRVRIPADFEPDEETLAYIDRLGLDADEWVPIFTETMRNKGECWIDWQYRCREFMGRVVKNEQRDRGTRWVDPCG